MEPDLLQPVARLTTSIVTVAAVTSIGLVRRTNEDRFQIARIGDLGLLAVIADGMGGQDGGEIAAETAIASFQLLERKDSPASMEQRYEQLLEAFYVADSRIAANTDFPGMGATVVAVEVTSSGMLHLHAGDSRCYHIRDGVVLYRTVDHSVAQLAGLEAATSGGYASLVTSCVGGPGTFASLTVDPAWTDGGGDAFRNLKRGDQLVLCSDGLWNLVPDDAIAVTVFEAASNPDQAALSLASLALDRGGTDNITVIVIDVLADLPALEESVR